MRIGIFKKDNDSRGNAKEDFPRSRTKDGLTPTIVTGSGVAAEHSEHTCAVHRQLPSANPRSI